MTAILSLHRQAMDLADRAYAARHAGEPETASRFFREAFDLESQAAEAVSANLDAEPTRSVLYRSAATLALQCGLLEAAAKLIREGLAGNPPTAIADELQSLMESSDVSRPTAADMPRLREFFETTQWTINYTFQLPSRQAQFFDPRGLALAAPTLRYLESRFPDGIYGHQLDALKLFGERKHLCLATGTASGKSMVFYAAAIEHLLQHPKSRVLLVYPLKALGREQESRIREAVESAGLNVAVGRIDGQVPSSSRAAIVRKSRILILTPDIIHAWLLGSLGEPAVREFLKYLGLVIVDEVHNYSGVFGSNAAFLFRRLRHLADLLRGKWSYICASATIANPEAHLRKLFGVDFHIIGPESDTSPRNSVGVWLLTPPRFQDLLSEITELFRVLASGKDHRFIAFVDSRKQVEYLSAIFRRGEAETQDEVYGRDYLDSMQVLPFRAGYELDDRNKIQDRLTQGSLRGVVSTSALELGIDIPFLDTGVLVGVPSSLTSLLQRIGRIGRHKEGTVLVVNRGDIQDQQAFQDPDRFMARPLTESSLYLENQHIQYLHALCLARHGGEHDTVAAAQPGADPEFVSSVEWPVGFVELCNKERIGEVPTDLQAMKMEGGEDPNHVFPLRDVESQFHVELKQGPEQRQLGSLTHSQVLREAYPGAVYYYTGQPFRVYRVYQQAKKIQVRRESHYTTKPTLLPTLVFPNLSAGNVHRAVQLGELTAIDCNLQIRNTVVGFRERRGPSEFPVQYPTSSQEGGIWFDLPRFTRNYFTTGVVFTHPAFSRSGVDGGLCSQLLYEAFVSLIPFERQDVGAACDRHRTDRGTFRRGQVFVALHDQTYGSLRLSSRVLDGDYLAKVLERVAQLVEAGGFSEAEPITAKALQDVALEAAATGQALSFDGPAGGQPQAGGRIKVIMPGSRGLNLLRNNEEFEVQRVFFSPTLQAVAYSGRHAATAEADVIEIVSVESVEPIPGESLMGQYEPESGELEELGTA